MVRLDKLSFENYGRVLRLEVNENQKDFVEEPATVIALAYAGMEAHMPGELCVIYKEEEVAGVVLIGRAEVEEQEPTELQKYKHVYRIMGFQIDQKYQGKGIGRKAFSLILDKIAHYPDGQLIPVALEVEEKNTAALHLYQSFDFYDSGIRYGDACAYIRMPKENPSIR